MVARSGQKGKSVLVPIRTCACHGQAKGRVAAALRLSPFTEEGYLSRMRPQLGAVFLPARSESVTQKRYAAFVFAFGACQTSEYT